MKKLLLTLILLLSAASLLAAPSSFQVVVKGSGRPMILIPGLSSPCEVWEGTIRHYSDRYEVHCVTLAGFAGIEPVKGEFLPRVRRELVEYIKTRKLDRPIIVGHSLGGFLAYWIASTEPGLVGPIVAVDGLPALGALMNPAVTAEELARQGDAFYRMITAQTPEQFAAQTRGSLAQMITKKEDLDRIAEYAVKSDPATVALAVKELMSLDLRQEVRKIRTPLLLIAAPGGIPSEMAAGIRERYEAQIAAVPDHQTVVATSARHFVMLDDPAFFFSTLDAFLKETSGKRARRLGETR